MLRRTTQTTRAGLYKGIVPGPPALRTGGLNPALKIQPDLTKHWPITHYEAWVTNALARGNQPTASDLTWIKNVGKFRSVVNLRIENDADRATCSTLKLNYLQIPVVDKSVPTDQQVIDFLNWISKPENQPCFVHCFAGLNRTGIFTACSLMAIQGLPLKDALTNATAFGFHQQDQINFVKAFGEKLNRHEIPGFPA